MPCCQKCGWRSATLLRMGNRLLCDRCKLLLLEKRRQVKTPSWRREVGFDR